MYKYFDISAGAPYTGRLRPSDRSRLGDVRSRASLDHREHAPLQGARSHTGYGRTILIIDWLLIFGEEVILGKVDDTDLWDIVCAVPLIDDLLEEVNLESMDFWIFGVTESAIPFIAIVLI